jgi:hypothetical protein
LSKGARFKLLLGEILQMHASTYNKGIFIDKTGWLSGGGFIYGGVIITD